MKILKNNIYQGSRGRKSLYDLFYIEDGKPKPVLIFSHGFKGFKDHGCFDLMGKYWAEKGFAFVKFNFSYNGGTTEKPIDFPDLNAFSENNYSTEVADLEIIIDQVIEGNFFPKEEINTDKIYLMGHSRGGGITILCAAKDERVKKFVTLGSVSSLDRFPVKGDELNYWKKQDVIHIENLRTKQMMPLKYQFYEDFKANEKELDIATALKSLNKPYLNIHGAEDESVSVKEAEIIKNWNDDIILEIIEDGNHSFGSQHPWEQENLPADFKKAVDKAFLFLTE